MNEMSPRVRRNGTKYCSALYCYNSRAKNRDLSFFAFPTNPERCMQWVQNCKRLDLPNKDLDSLHKCYQLCTAHFEDHCFTDPKTKNRLKPNAVPSIFNLKDTSDLEMSNCSSSESEWPENSTEPGCSSEEMMHKTIFSENTHINLGDVTVKIEEEEEMSLSENSLDVSSVFNPEINIKLEPENTEPYLYSFEEPNVKKELKDFDTSNVKREPRIFSEVSSASHGYIIPDKLDEVFSSQNALEGNPHQTTESTSRSRRKQILQPNILYDNEDLQPVLLTMTQPSTGNPDGGTSATKPEESQSRNRRKQVLKPLKDLEDEPLIDQFIDCPPPTLNDKRIDKNKPSKVYRCDECGNEFVLLKFFKNHKKNHRIQKKLKCAICHISYQTLDDLSDHCLSHEFDCVVCKKSFTNAGGLSRHVITHPGMKPYKCSVCKLRFSSLFNSKLHERDYHVNTREKFPCSLCLKEFDSLENLRTHAYVHTHDRPFKCCYCNSSFISFKSLSLHTRNSHSNAKEHKCHECGKKFGMAYLLIRHYYSSKEKCNICNKEFSRGCALVKHMKSHVQNVQSYSCKVCKATFSVRNHAHKHARTLHPAELEFVKYSKHLIDYITSDDTSTATVVRSEKN